MKEHRKTPRFGPLVIKTQVNIYGNKREGFLTNLSRAGAFLAIDDPPSDGAHLDVWALLPWRLGELRAHARVVWRNEQEKRDDTTAEIVGVGITFTELEQGSAELLKLYLTRFAELAAQVE
ncbi:MAG: PilZ domain-containing protein [Acidobacteria bacterium]|nr:MAG: PilZ domain-containing protein [Acidobacteriota bacterium]